MTVEQQKNNVMPVQGAASVPMVSLGLPVYNGERFLEKTLVSLLGQTFTDFELIICDNASTDSTADICARYAAQDPRIRYFRNDINLGAGPNYDLCFHRAVGKYFKWCAHDDVLTPDFLERTVAALEADPEATYCSVGVVQIGENDEFIQRWTKDSTALTSPSAGTRFAAALLWNYGTTGFFSIIRRDALAGSRLHGRYGGADLVFFTQLALRGRAVVIPDTLFYDRTHPNRLSVYFGNRDAVTSWFDTKKAGRRDMYYIKTYLNYWTVMLEEKLPWSERWICVRALMKWWTAKNLQDMVYDVLWFINPALARSAGNLKRSLLRRRTADTGGAIG